MKQKIIITGATGMVGEGVLHACLVNENVEAVLIINRKPSGFAHPKLKEIIHADFFNITPLAAEFKNYTACFFCLGVSSVGMKEAPYTHLTYDLTMHIAQVMSAANAAITFCYISGSGTDSTEKGKLMWARVKGKTENDLMQLPFKQVFNFRPGALIASPGAKNVLPYYNYFAWLLPGMRRLFPNMVCTLHELGNAMLKVSEQGYEKKILEVADIVKCVSK
jgi:uncharacterized protein YbjT (DUF2867 family)